MHYVPSIHVRISACQSYAQHIFVLFCLDFIFYFFCIHMSLYHVYNYVSIYQSVTFIHTMSPVCVCLSVSLSLSLFLSLSPSPFVLFYFTSLCRYSMCTIVFVCLSHSCHILVSTLTVRINLVNCVVTHVSLIARPLGCLFVFCV